MNPEDRDRELDRGVGSAQRARPRKGGAGPGESSRRLESSGAGWWGRVTAALIGGSILSFAVGVSVTIYVPGFDGLDQAFMGGLALVAIWPPIMLWALFARSGWRAWKRVLILVALFLAIDLAGLLL